MSRNVDIFRVHHSCSCLKQCCSSCQNDAGLCSAPGGMTSMGTMAVASPLCPSVAVVTGESQSYELTDVFKECSLSTVDSLGGDFL